MLLYHSLRREEAASLMVAAFQGRRGILHLCIHGKGGKAAILPVHATAVAVIHGYLEMSSDQLVDAKPPLFIPIRARSTGPGISACGIYQAVAS